MAITVDLQILRKGTKYESYRVSLPRDIILSKGWERSKFKMTLKENKIILEAVKK